MDLFNQKYTPPRPSEPTDWMLHKALTAGPVRWEKMRQEPQTEKRVRRAIALIPESERSGMLSLSGCWGYCSLSLDPSLRYTWAYSWEDQFQTDRRVLQRADLVQSAARVMGLSLSAAGRSGSVPVRSIESPIKHLQGVAPKTYRMPPMSVRHKYQQGASRLRWPSMPPETKEGRPAQEKEKVAFTIMLRRGASTSAPPLEERPLP